MAEKVTGAGVTEETPKFPSPRAAECLSELKFKEDSQAYGIHELPVAW